MKEKLSVAGFWTLYPLLVFVDWILYRIDRYYMQKLFNGDIADFSTGVEIAAWHKHLYGDDGLSPLFLTEEEVESLVRGME